MILRALNGTLICSRLPPPRQLERKAEVARELKHTARHTGKYINTSTWNAGVRQRMETKQLYEHLAKEYRTLKVLFFGMALSNDCCFYIHVLVTHHSL